VAPNICKAVEYFRKMGGNVGVADILIHQDDGSGNAQAFAEAAGIPALISIPANEDIRKKSANCQIIGTPGGQWGSLFEELGENVAAAPPVRPTPLTGDGLLALFSPVETDANATLRPATQADMRGVSYAARPTLEAVYDAV